MKNALQYLFNIFILFKTIFCLKFSFILKLDKKLVLLKTWKKFRKPGVIFLKIFGNPVFYKKKNAET